MLNYYGTNTLIHLTQYQTGADLANIPELSAGTYTDLSSYRQFFLLLLQFLCYMPESEEYYIWISHSSTGSGTSVSSSVFYGFFIEEEVYEV
jgi:hypothetical protein